MVLDVNIELIHTATKKMGQRTKLGIFVVMIQDNPGIAVVIRGNRARVPFKAFWFFFFLGQDYLPLFAH